MESVGFDSLPRPVVLALAGVLLGEPIAADADRPVTKRRNDGTYYQQTKGWWAGHDRYVSIDARRLLVPTGEKSFKPTTGWKIDGTISHFAPRVAPTRSQWHFDPAESTTSGRGQRRSVDNALEALPELLTAPLRGADANAWRRDRPGWAEETIVASLATPARVLVLKAERSTQSLRSLETADWHAVTVDAPIVAVQSLRTDPAGRVLVGPAVNPTQLEAGSPRRDSIER